MAHIRIHMEKRSRYAVCNLLTGRGRSSGGGHVCRRAGKGPYTFDMGHLFEAALVGVADGRVGVDQGGGPCVAAVLAAVLASLRQQQPPVPDK